eukprot:6377647-Pyramimonas_sp.AAC.1
MAGQGALKKAPGGPMARDSSGPPLEGFRACWASGGPHTVEDDEQNAGQNQHRIDMHRALPSRPS